MKRDPIDTSTASRPLAGQAIERIEDLRFLRGEGQYLDDLTLPHMLHAVVVRSSLAHGTLRSIDATAALALPGVHAVITARDIGIPVPRIPMRLDVLDELHAYEQPVIAEHKVRYVGEPIAVVLADSPALAEDGADQLIVDIEPLPVVTTRGGEAPALLFEDTGRNLAVTLRAGRGEVDAIFRDAPYTRREQFSVQRHAAMPMEPRGLLAFWNAEASHLTILGACKVPHANRRVLAGQLGLPEAAIDMQENDVGGGFGARGEFYPEDYLIAFAARHARRPVKWVEDRREHLLATNHARDAECDLEIACTREGHILALRGHAHTDLGAYIRTNGVTPSRNIAQVCCGPYRIEHVQIDVSVHMTNKTPVGTYRGPGRFETDFFRERLLDIVAADLGLDRVAFRRANLVRSTDMPWSLPVVMPWGGGSECDSGDYASTLAHALREFDWDAKRALDGQLIDGRYHGIAIGCYLEGGASGPREGARLRLHDDGRVGVYVGSSSIGQGLETVFTQIACDALDIAPEDIAGIFHGSTSYVNEGFGAYSSRSTVMGGSAVVVVAAPFKEHIRAAAAPLLGCAPDQVSLARAIASGPHGETVSFRQIAEHRAQRAEPVQAEGHFASNRRTYSYGAHATHVAVDPGTGRVEVIDYVAVEDVGRIINPATLHGQALGAIVQGLGGVFLEHLVHDEHGQLLTASFADYLLPGACDFPNIRVFALEEHPSPNNPLGAKGAGEGGIIPVGGVIANAVASALRPLNVGIHELPLSPAKLWASIADVRHESAGTAS